MRWIVLQLEAAEDLTENDQRPAISTGLFAFVPSESPAK
jgi:hypothetical protein